VCGTSWGRPSRSPQRGWQAPRLTRTATPVGRVYLAIAGHGLEADCRRFDFGEMDADAILARTVDAALLMLAGLLGRDAG
jgi:nicotinamide mononucleotide (NMN) deamidase PncC